MLKIFLAYPMGFCAGVTRAIQTLEMLIKKNRGPVYVLHEIVHNDHVLDRFRQLGVKFVEDIAAVPEGSALVFSAHGVSQDVENLAKTRNLHIVDATCPLVKKNHLAIARNEKHGSHTILIGSPKHAEIIGSKGRAKPENVTVIENEQQIAEISIPRHNSLTYLTQTTLSMEGVAQTISTLKKRYPDITGPKSGNICYATQNRQNAVKLLAKQNIQLLLVVGDKNSSNSNKLRLVGAQEGIASYLVPGPEDINLSWFKNVRNIGITAGASTPDSAVQQTLAYLQTNFCIKEIKAVVLTEEKVKFKLPAV